MEEKKYLDIIGLGIFKALNDKRYPILVNGKISESAIPTSITNSITSILSLIPDAASSENKLADKNFVNSSIATNTATFRGTFDDLATLQATSADINDYAFYVHTDEIGNTAYDRYKHNGSAWVFEYTLNNSSFTAEQWSAINSGITTTKVGNYDAHLINYSNPHKVTKSQVGLGNVENVALSSWAGSNKITTLGTITTGVWNGTKITNTYLANSSITIGTTAISLGSTAKSLAGITKLQLNDANSNLAYDSTTGSWKLTGNLLVTGFISAGAKGNSSSGGGSTYTQREWAEIKIMSASDIGLLASAYSVKEAYEELNAVIEALASKATNVKFSQTITSGKQIGTLTIDNIGTILYAPANYAWSEVTGKPTFATVATSGSYTDLTNKPTIASLMGSTAIGGTSSYLYWNGSAWATKALGSNAFTSISKVSQLTNDSGYITGITKSMVEGVLTGNITSHSHSNYVDLTSFQTITGNKKFSGSIQVGAIGINTDNIGLYGYGEDAVEIHAENILTLCGERNTYIGNADNSAMVDIQEDMAGYNAETGVETWYIYRDGYAEFQSILGALANSLAIKLNGGTTEGTNLFTFNNSASKTINITPSAIGAAAASHTHSYLPLAGGTMSNTNVVTNLNADLLDGLHAASFYQSKSLRSDKNSIYDLRFNYGTYDKGDYGGTYNGEYPTNYGVYLALTYNDKNTGALMFFDAPTNNVLGHIYVRTRGAGDSNTTYSEWGTLAYLTDNVASSSKWANARTITLTGSVTGSVSIDGSQNVSLATTTNHTHNYAGSSSAGGSANSALTLLYNNKFDTIYGSYAIFQQSSNISDFPHDGWFNSIKMLHNNSSGYFTEIAMSFTGEDGMWRRALLGGTQAGWYKMLDSGNFNSYAPKLDGTGASGTWGINISGNAATATNADTLDGVHYQNILERYYSGSASSGTATGWFRIAETPVKDIAGITFILAIQRNFAYANNESYLFSISISHNGGISITQLSGYANKRLITKIRVDWYPTKIAYVDLYINSSTTNNQYYWYTVGCAKSYTAWTANPTLVGTAYEFTTVQGCKSDRGFTGDIVGNASSATKLQNSRTIWGQSFDGTGNVSGALSGVTDITASGTLKLTFSDARYLTINGGGIDFHTYNSGWATGYNLNDTNNSLIGVIAGGYGNGNTLNYYYYGGTYSSPKMVILNANGNVGIGTTNPSYKLDVNGSARVTTAITAQHLAAQFIELVSATPFIDFHYNNSTADFTSRIIEGLSGQLTVTGKLRVGLGFTTSTDYALHIVGTAYSSAGLITDGAISAAKTSTSSDIRLKDNISEIGSKTALQWLLMLKPKSWTWNDKAVVTGQSMGFVAQDVEGILPQMVKKQDNGYLSLDYTQLHALEVAGLQDHEKRIEELERENKILKEELNKLKLNAN